MDHLNEILIGLGFLVIIASFVYGMKEARSERKKVKMPLILLFNFLGLLLALFGTVKRDAKMAEIDAVKWKVFAQEHNCKKIYSKVNKGGFTYSRTAWQCDDGVEYERPE